MDPSLVNCSSFSIANPSNTLPDIWPFPVNDVVPSGLRLAVNSGQVFNRSEHSGNKDVSLADESTVTDLTAGWGRRKTRDLKSEDDSSKMVSSSSSGNELKESGRMKRKFCGSESGNGDSSIRSEGETSSGCGGSKTTEQKNKPEPPKDYIHVRARRGQATDRHSLAERARREKISEKMTALQDMIPGCNKITGKALVLDEIINYIQSMQRQVEFLSMKLEVVNSGSSTVPTIGSFPSGDLGTLPSGVHRTIYEQQEAKETRVVPYAGS